MTTITIDPCRAGFEGCDAMRADEIARHPRTARLAECRHMAIPAERPERLQGPEVGALCRYVPRSGVQEIVRVVERSYVWAPGDASYGGGSRRYDWKVIERQTKGRLCVDDKDLAPVEVAI